MTLFRYRALTPAGTVVSGEIEAADAATARAQLRGNGNYTIDCAPAEPGGWRALLTRELRIKRKISQRDLGMATRHLAMLLAAGLPLDRALGVLAGLDDITRLRPSVLAALDRLRDGSALGDALAEDPAFPPLYVSMIRAGELGGNLEHTLLRLADYLAKAHAVRETVLSALIYPLVLMCTAGLSMAVILLVVLPQFEPLFLSAGKSLPLATQVVMAIGDGLAAFWWVILTAIAAGSAVFRRALKQPIFRWRWDGLVLRLPLVGGLLTKIILERFSRTLGSLLDSGLALPGALAITRDTVGNAAFAEALGSAALGLREGDGLAERLARSAIFPAMALDFIRIGEETGKLDAMLIRQADIYEHAVRNTVERLLALLVPALTVLMGLMVAGLVTSMLVAIIGINDLAVR